MKKQYISSLKTLVPFIIISSCQIRNFETQPHSSPANKPSLAVLTGYGTGKRGIPDSQFVTIPAGEFEMGLVGNSSRVGMIEQNRVPKHRVHVSTFKYQQSLVTQWQYYKVRASLPPGLVRAGYNNRRDYCPNPGDYEVVQSEGKELNICLWMPVTHVAYGLTNESRERHTIINFLASLNEQHPDPRTVYRLPTEAEFEKAKQGPDVPDNPGYGAMYSFGNFVRDPKRSDTADSMLQRFEFFNEHMWYERNSHSNPHNIAQKLPNGYGLYDMSGNLWQWVYDKYDPDFYRKPEATQKDTKGPQEYSPRYYLDHVIRGGSWNTAEQMAATSYRDKHDAYDVNYYVPNGTKNRGSELGFRVVIADKSP